MRRAGTGVVADRPLFSTFNLNSALYATDPGTRSMHNIIINNNMRHLYEFRAERAQLVDEEGTLVAPKLFDPPLGPALVVVAHEEEAAGCRGILAAPSHRKCLLIVMIESRSSHAHSPFVENGQLESSF